MLLIEKAHSQFVVEPRAYEDEQPKVPSGFESPWEVNLRVDAKLARTNRASMNGRGAPLVTLSTVAGAAEGSSQYNHTPPNDAYSSNPGNIDLVTSRTVDRVPMDAVPHAPISYTNDTGTSQ